MLSFPGRWQAGGGMLGALSSGILGPSLGVNSGYTEGWVLGALPAGA